MSAKINLNPQHYIDEIKKYFDQAQDALKKIPTEVTDGVNSISNKVSSGLTSLGHKIEEGAATVSAKTSAGLSSLETKISGGVESLEAKVTDTSKSFEAALDTAASKTKSDIEAVYNDAKGDAESVVKSIEAAGQQAVAEIKKEAGTLKDEIEHDLENLTEEAFKKFLSALKGAADKAIEYLENFEHSHPALTAQLNAIEFSFQISALIFTYDNFLTRAHDISAEIDALVNGDLDFNIDTIITSVGTVAPTTTAIDEDAKIEFIVFSSDFAEEAIKEQKIGWPVFAEIGRDTLKALGVPDGEDGDKGVDV